MANFVKSSCVLSIPHPGGGTSQINGYMVCWSGLKFTISTPDGSKVLAMKSYHQKSVDTSYMILTTTPDTDGSLAKEDTTASTRDLAADEYRVCVTHKGYEGTNESIMMDQELFYPYEKIQQWGGLRWYLKGASNDTRSVQVTFDAAKIPTITDIELHVTETSNGSMVFGGIKVETSNGLMSYKVPQKLSMLVKRDDGSVWTLGGSDVPANVVTTNEEQVITAGKVFTAVPKVTAEPTAKDDVATVGLINDMIFGKGPFKTDLSLICEPTNASSWVVVSNAEVILDNGKKLKCIHLENTAPTVATAPVKCVFKLIDESEAITEQPQRQEASFFDTYSLQDGELLGSVTYGHLLNSEWQEYSTYYAPFHNAQYGCQGATKECPLMHISIDEVPAAVNKLKLNLTSYLPKTMKATVVCGGMSAESNLIDNPSAQTYELEFNTTGGGGLVTLDTEQTITGKKTFDTIPSLKTEPQKPFEVVNKSYVDKLKYPIADYTMTLFMKPRLQNYQGISNMVFRLQSGASLKPLYIENTEAQTAKKHKIIYEVTYDPMPSAVRPARIAPDALAAHLNKMQDNWIEGTIEYAPSFNPDICSESSVWDPFDCYVPWFSGDTNTFYKFLEFTFKGLFCPLDSVDATIGSSQHDETRKPNAYKCTLATPSVTVNTEELDVSGMPDDNPISIKFADDFSSLMYTDKAQLVTGLKTFEVLPQSEATPTDAKDLVTKAYLDAALGSSAEIPDAPVKHTEVLMRVMQDNATQSWAAFNHMKFFTRSGKTVKPLYIENTDPNKADAPVQVIYTLADDSASGTSQDKSFFESYSLKEGEFKGTITFSKLCDANWETHTNNIYWNPYNIYLAYDKTDIDEVRDYLKFTFEKLPSMLGKVEFTNGDPNNQNGYISKEVGFEVTADAYAFTSKMLTKEDDHLDRGSTHTVEFEYKEASGPLPPNLVTLDTDQTITALKTFGKLPKSTAVPADEAELVNKKYVDDAVAAAGGGSGAGGNVTVSVFGKNPKDWPFGISEVKFSTTDGKFLVPVYIEETISSNATKPPRFVVKIADSFVSTHQKKPADFFDTYQLQDGEYFGSYVPAHLCGSEHMIEGYVGDYNYQTPFSIYAGKITSEVTEPLKFLEYNFEGLPADLSKVEYTVWTVMEKIQFSVSSKSKHFVSKVYDKTDDSLTERSVHEVPFQYKDSNYVTLETEQTITGLKTFAVLPQSEKTPSDSKDLVTKAYVDSKTDGLQGYTITIFGKTGAANKQLGFYKVRMYFANGARLYPKLQASDYSFPSNKPVPYIWTLDYSNPNYPDPSAGSMTSTEMNKYKLTPSEYRGFISTPNLLGKFTIANDRYFALGGSFHVYGDTTEEQGVVRFQVDGSLPPITKIELVTDNNTAFQGTAVRAEVCRIGDAPKSSQEVAITGVDQQITLTFEDAYIPDPYYVNRFDNQDVHGVKTFKTLPVLDKNPQQYGIGIAYNPAAFGDIDSGIAQAYPIQQSLSFYIGITTDKYGGSMNGKWKEKYTCTINISNLHLKIRRADNYEEQELFLKAVGPSKDGYRGILSFEKPRDGVVQDMEQSSMDSYTLRQNEYFCKLQYYTRNGHERDSEKELASALASGSNMIKTLFGTTSTQWWTSTSSEHQAHASAHNPDDIPWGKVALYIYNCPIVSSYTVYNSSTKEGYNTSDTITVFSPTTSSGQQTSWDYNGVIWSQRVKDVQLQSVNVLAALRALQKRATDLEAKNKTLEEKVKALEAAAPQP